MAKGSVLSKPKFIGRVLDAIFKLSEKHGSSAKNILNFVLKNSKTINRNLTVQIQHALKRAVSEGLIELVGSRYKLRRDRQRQEAAAKKSAKTLSISEPPKSPTKPRRTKRKKPKMKEKISKISCPKDPGTSSNSNSSSSKKKGKGSGSSSSSTGSRGKPSSRSQSKTNKKNPSVK